MSLYGNAAVGNATPESREKNGNGRFKVFAWSVFLEQLNRRSYQSC